MITRLAAQSSHFEQGSRKIPEAYVVHLPRVPRALQSAATLWDAFALLRAALATGLGLVVVTLVTAASDEGGLSWATRVGRALPVSPVCAAFGVWAALGPVRARGELVALASLGRRTRQIAAAAVVGAVCVCTASCLAIAIAPSVDVASFYPTARPPPTWRWIDGRFVNPSRGVEMQADGTLVASRIQEPVVSPAAVPRFGRPAAAIATLLAGVALALLAARALVGGSGRRLDALACAAVGFASVVLFQTAAARHTSALVSPLPALGLAAFAWRRFLSLP